MQIRLRTISSLAADATHEQVARAAKKACCHDFISALPEGYDTVIGEGGGTLSGGEKQRISIARAMLKNAPIIILDEATSSVDPENEDELQRAIEALNPRQDHHHDCPPAGKLFGTPTRSLCWTTLTLSSAALMQS